MPTVKSVVEQNIKNGLYDEEILNKFDDETWTKINDIVDHSIQNLLLHLIKKCLRPILVKNRHNGYVYETPQYSFIVIVDII
jgi:ribonucleoside-diphosphate reductase alpha chain